MDQIIIRILKGKFVNCKIIKTIDSKINEFKPEEKVKKVVKKVISKKKKKLLFNKVVN